MHYVVAVRSPICSQGSTLAYQFVETLLEKNYCVDQVFFFQEGVTNANQLISSASDETNLVAKWQSLAKKYSLALHLCIAAAQRRGVVDETTSDSDKTNLAQGFILAGLGEFTQVTLNADRLITF